VTIFVELQLHGAHAPQLSPQTINALTKIYHSGELSRPHDKYDIALIIARTQPDTPLLKQCYNEMIEFCRDNPASLNTIVVDLLFKTSRYFEKIENNSALLNEFTQSYQEIIGRYILDIERHMPEEHEQRLEAINTIIVMIYKCEQGGALQIPATMMPRIATILQTLDGNIDPEYKQKIAKAQKFLEQSSRVESLIEPSPTSVDKIDAFDVRGYKRRV
jgi:hypothetical protein